MSDLDLLQAIYRGVSLNRLDDIPEGSTNWFKATRDGDVYEFVIDADQIKQAFIGAGYIKVPQVLRDTSETLILMTQYQRSDVLKQNGFMTGQEWYKAFSDEIYKLEFPLEPKVKSAVERCCAAAKRAAGIE